MEELYRNLAIAMLCVFVTIMVLIANVYSCLLVLLCVFLTLVSDRLKAAYCKAKSQFFKL
jgi:hypothetical protein